MDNKHKSISYAKWGYIFIAPFIIVFILCQLIPLFSTFYNSFFENYMDGLNHIGPNFVGFDNYVKLFTPSSNGKISISMAYREDTEKLCDTSDEVLEYMVGSDRLRDVITQVTVLDRSI